MEVPGEDYQPIVEYGDCHNGIEYQGKKIRSALDAAPRFAASALQFLREIGAHCQILPLHEVVAHRVEVREGDLVGVRAE